MQEKSSQRGASPHRNKAEAIGVQGFHQNFIFAQILSALSMYAISRSGGEEGKSQSFTAF